MKDAQTGNPLPIEISVQEASQVMEDQTSCCLLDVREPAEYQASRISGSLHIPLMQLPMRLQEVPRNTRILVLCHHGHRSLRAAGFLRSSGWESAQSVRGGIDAWSREVDPALPRY